MKIKIKPKSFGPVFVHDDADGNLGYGLQRDDQAAEILPANSPAEMLLFSLGACIAISIRLAAKKDQVINPFSVEVRSSKAQDLPGRFGMFDVVVDRDICPDPGQARDLIAAAKSICTVSNSLNAEVTLTLSD